MKSSSGTARILIARPWRVSMPRARLRQPRLGVTDGGRYDIRKVRRVFEHCATL